VVVPLRGFPEEYSFPKALRKCLEELHLSYSLWGLNPRDVNRFCGAVKHLCREGPTAGCDEEAVVAVLFEVCGQRVKCFDKLRHAGRYLLRLCCCAYSEIEAVTRLRRRF